MSVVERATARLEGGEAGLHFVRFEPTAPCCEARDEPRADALVDGLVGKPKERAQDEAETPSVEIVANPKIGPAKAERRARVDADTSSLERVVAQGSVGAGVHGKLRCEVGACLERKVDLSLEREVDARLKRQVDARFVNRFRTLVRNAHLA
jgi:hypothetical protein